jgi:hypothetical protein
MRNIVVIVAGLVILLASQRATQMHPYDTDKEEERADIRDSLILVAIILTLALKYIVDTYHIPIPWFLDVPAVIGIYRILLKLYDKYLWRLHGGSNLRLSSIPYVGGTWVGTLYSSYNNSIVEVVVYVRQTSTRIILELESSGSTSHTIMAAFYIDSANYKRLHYEYLNEPKRGAPTPWHWGTAHLRLALDYETLAGNYYNNEGNKTDGAITLHLLTRKFSPFEEALALGRQRKLI